MIKNKIRNKKLMFAANMPPLYHKLPDQEYSQQNSEVLKWLAERSMLIEYIFDQASNAKEIIYNSETGKWQGVDYEPNND